MGKKMDNSCKSCKETGCCCNCTEYINSYTFEYMTHIKCSIYNEVQKQDNGYPIINGVVDTNCKYWKRS
ncbi:MAG: hypothetical protein ACW98X_21545 [Promethearchaeota archaeon]|jgi:hypothetical protein